MKVVSTIVALLFSITIFGQTAPDFTVTDSDGASHTLYQDYLDQGTTVVIELFFVNCPPCRAVAPSVENLYQEWGGGEYDVQFIKLSTQNGDSNADVAGFKAEFGTTFPGVGFDGGAETARQPYRDGTFGPYFGTPQFSVIAPDGTVNHGVGFGNLSAAIEATGATGEGGMVEPDNFTTYELMTVRQSQSAPESVTYYLTDGGDITASSTVNITAMTNGSNTFDYPSDDFPEVNDPQVTALITGPVLTDKIKASDLLRILRHILELNPIQSEAQLLAADINGDGIVRSGDLLGLQKVILEINNTFPNGNPSWVPLVKNVSLTPDVGNLVPISYEIVKVGDVNF